MRTHIGFTAKNLTEAIEKLSKVGFIFDNQSEIFLNVEGYERSQTVGSLANAETPKAEAPKAEEKVEEPKQEEKVEEIKEEKIEAPKKEAKKAKKEEAPKEEIKEETKPALTIEDIKNAGKTCAKKHGLEALKEILASYGAKQISEVKPEDFEAIHAELVG